MLSKHRETLSSLFGSRSSHSSRDFWLLSCHDDGMANSSRRWRIRQNKNGVGGGCDNKIRLAAGDNDEFAMAAGDRNNGIAMGTTGWWQRRLEGRNGGSISKQRRPSTTPSYCTSYCTSYCLLSSLAFAIRMATTECARAASLNVFHFRSIDRRTF